MSYEDIAYEYTGSSTIVVLCGSAKQEGVLVHLRKTKPVEKDDIGSAFNSLDIFLGKRDCAQLAKTMQEGRKFWRRFRLPKMYEQQVRHCDECGRYTAHNKIAGKWKCINHG